DADTAARPHAARVAGVRVGQVKAVELRGESEWPVIFTVELDEGAPVARESAAYFSSDGLLGTNFLALEPMASGQTPIADGDELYGVRASASLGDMLSQMGGVVDRAVVLLEETTGLVRTLGGRVDPLLDRVEALASEENAEEVRVTLRLLRQTLEETGPKLPALLERVEETLGSVEAGVGGVPAVTDEARLLLGDLRASIGPDGQRLSGLLDSADGTLGAASSTLGAVAGSVGDLEAAMRDLRATADHLEDLTRTLGERPNRLIFPSRREDRRPGEGSPNR
ncbi:MAG: MlaD family protein, partial [Acidobacteriota bacterium]